MNTQTTSEILKIDKSSATSKVKSLKGKFKSLKCKYSYSYKVSKKTTQLAKWGRTVFKEKLCF